MTRILGVLASLAILVALTGHSEALEVKKTSRAVVEGMCGGGIQTGGGHSGCTICTTKMCTDYDCTKKSCKLVNFIKGQQGGIRTGVTSVNGKTGSGTTGLRHPVKVGTGIHPVASGGQGGGSQSFHAAGGGGGGHHR